MTSLTLTIIGYTFGPLIIGGAIGYVLGRYHRVTNP